MPTIDIQGVPHAYELTPPSPLASAPVLIFIHGWLLSRNYWQPLLERLSPEYQCLIYDLRGFGDSQPIAAAAEPQIEGDCLSSRYSLAAYAEDLRLLLQKLAIDRAWLVGHSLGGSIALWGAEICPEVVKGVICLNAGGGIYLKEEFERFRQAGQQLVRRRPPWLAYFPLIDYLFARLVVARPLNRQWGRQRVVDFLKADAGAALGSLLDCTTEAEVHLLPQIVSRLQQPVYFLAGEKDKVMEPKYVRHLASFHRLFEMSARNVIEIPDCGHLSMLERPEIVSEKIAYLLQEHESGESEELSDFHDTVKNMAQ
jgi:pimeloyl-ACP methyl ester carboxylesterase